MARALTAARMGRSMGAFHLEGLALDRWRAGCKTPRIVSYRITTAPNVAQVEPVHTARELAGADPYRRTGRTDTRRAGEMRCNSSGNAAAWRVRRPAVFQRVLFQGALTLALGPLLACQSPALVRTARTLPQGGHDLSFSFNLTRVSLEEVQVQGTVIPLQDFNLPNPIPDVLYDHGLTDDVELGGRLSLGSGLMELHSKLRFVEAAHGTFHMALAPAVGYRVLALVNGPVYTLPLIVTYDLSPGMSVSGGPVASYASYSTPDSLEIGDLDLSGDTLYAGGGLGLEFRSALGIHVMPAVEVQRSVSRRGDVENLPIIDMLFFGVTIGWGSRRDSGARRVPNQPEERPEDPAHPAHQGERARLGR